MSLFEVFVVSLLFWFCFKKSSCVCFGLSMWNCGKEGQEQQKREERDEEEEQLKEVNIL